jgi:GR25 family glycosyltransferase involved in LPS biosynthesis
MKFNLKFKKQNNFLYIILFILIFCILIYLFYYILKNNNKEYFSQSIPIYIINLDRSPERWEKMKSQCINLNCIRINAIDGKNLDDMKYNDIMKKTKMKKNTIACFLSHLKCLNKFVKSNDEYVVILEDDVDIEKNFTKKINNLLKEIQDKNENFDIIFLGGTRVCGKKFSKSLLKIRQINKDCNAGTFGYLLSKKGAQKILDKFNQDGINKMYDHQLRDYFKYLNVFTCNPPVIIHDFDMPSVRINRKYNDNYIKNALSIKIK